MKKKYIWIILIISVVFNVLVLSIDTIPFILPKVENKLFKEVMITQDQSSERIILNQSLEMINSKSMTIWSDPKGFTETFYDLYHNRQLSEETKQDHYPKAFLYFGLTTYLIKKNDLINLEKVKISFDKLIDSSGKPIFNLDRVDQIPFGLTALNLYKVYGEIKYLNFCEILYDTSKKFTNGEGLILYRENASVQYYDVLGMVVPFLIEYGEFTNNQIAKSEAKKQLDYYIKYGVDKETYLPCHGITLSSKVKVGPTNWGRGIGWYFLGLTYYYRVTGDFKQEYEGLTATLNKLRTEEGLWTQFPGSSNKFDASTSTMFLYCMNNDDKLFNKKQIINNLYRYISKDGNILQTSGDTYDINRYSKSFGKSELSQGFLLLLL